MKKIVKNLLLSFILIASIISLSSATSADEPNIMVIANEKGAPSTLTMKELKSIFQGEKQRWNDGTKISIAFMKSSTPVGSATSKKVLKMSGDQLNKFWLALVFQGKAKAPFFYGSASEVESFVSQNAGAIGVVEAGYQVKGVKVISIDGKKSF
jgi:ABC-type phosphate transport system substrate-binding protein